MLNISGLSVKRGMGQSEFRVCLPNFSLEQGEAVAVQGVSGCGKSTLLEMIGLILKPDQVNRFQLLDQDVNRAIQSQNEIVLANIRSTYFGFMLQSGGLLPYLNVNENIRLSCRLTNQNIDEAWLNEMVQRLSIAHLLLKYPKQLSIGERQRVSFLRAIAHHPKILLADEPTAALDPNNASKLFDIIIELVKENHFSALIVTHDWDLVNHRKIPLMTATMERNQATFKRI